MKRLFVLLSISVLSLAFSACTETNGDTEINKLDTPVPSVASQTEDSFKVFWPKVEGAAYYTITLNGEEDIITDNYYEKSDLQIGTYNLTIMACANVEGMANSDVANITVTLEEETWFTQSAEPFRWNNPDYPEYVYLYDTYNSISMTFTVTGTKITSIDYALLEASETNDMTKDELIQKVIQNNKSIPSNQLNELNANGIVSLFATDIKPGTDFEFISIATNYDGGKLFRRSPVSTDPVPAPHKDIESWLGNWEVTCSHTRTFYYHENAGETGGSLFTDTLSATPQTFTVNIAIDETYANSLMITGLSVTRPDMPARGIYKPEEKTLDIYCGIKMGYDPLSYEFNADLELMWYAHGYDLPAGATTDQLDSCSLTQANLFVPVYKMSMFGSTVECENNILHFNDGTSFYMYGLEILSRLSDGSGIYPSLDDTIYPINCRAGKLTWTKK